MKNHLALTACDEIADMMLPCSKKHGITFFQYYKYFSDGSVIRLSTNRIWTEHYLKKDYLNSSTVPVDYLTNPVNYFIWLIDDCPEMLLDAAINFNISNGISIAKKNEDDMEYFCFASTTQNKSIVNRFYINHLDVLEQYCLFFKEQAEKLLVLCESDKLFLTQNTANTIDLSPKSGFNLSVQQTACANLLLRGMQYKEIGKTLNLSVRTIETYVDNIKRKLNCNNRTELIIKLLSIFK